MLSRKERKEIRTELFDRAEQLKKDISDAMFDEANKCDVDDADCLCECAHLVRVHNAISETLGGTDG